MKRKTYIQPEARIYEMSTMQMLASSEKLPVGNTEDDDVPTPSDGTIWGD